MGIFLRGQKNYRYPEKEPYISQIVGKAPEQYPNYEDDDFFDELFGDANDDDEEMSSYVSIEPELYKAAFDFKAVKPWTKLNEDDFFAVKFSDGVIGYVSVVGHRVNTLGLMLLIGNEGASCLKNIEDVYDPSTADRVDEFNFGIRQDCATLTFMCKSELDPGYVEDIRKFAKENGISLRGKNMFPGFVRYLPQRPPWSLAKEKDRKYMRQALEAATELAKRLENCDKSEFRFGEMPVMPLMKKTKNGYSCGSTMLPEHSHVKEYEPLRSDIVFKNYKTKVDLECGMLNLPTPIFNEKLSSPEYPVVIMCIESMIKLKTSFREEDLMITDPISYTDAVSEDMLKSFTECLIENRITPKTIKVSDERTRALLSDICKRCGVELIVEKALPDLEDVIHGLLDCLITELLEDRYDT